MKTLVEKLKNYNRWRRGDDSIPQPSPKEVGEMIAQAIEALKAYLKQMEGEKEHPKQLPDIMNKIQSFTHICKACNGDGVLDKRHGFAYGSVLCPCCGGGSEKEAEQ